MNEEEIKQIIIKFFDDISYPYSQFDFKLLGQINSLSLSKDFVNTCLLVERTTVKTKHKIYYVYACSVNIPSKEMYQLITKFHDPSIGEAIKFFSKYCMEK